MDMSVQLQVETALTLEEEHPLGQGSSVNQCKMKQQQR
jgi:hypothetical protein